MSDFQGLSHTFYFSWQDQFHLNFNLRLLKYMLPRIYLRGVAHYFQVPSLVPLTVWTNWKNKFIYRVQPLPLPTVGVIKSGYIGPKTWCLDRVCLLQDTQNYQGFKCLLINIDLAEWNISGYEASISIIYSFSSVFMLDIISKPSKWKGIKIHTNLSYSFDITCPGIEECEPMPIGRHYEFMFSLSVS